MRLKPPDSSEQDYKDRRLAFVKQLVADTSLDMPTRLMRLEIWLETNSPYTPGDLEKHLFRAITGKDPP